MASGLEAYLRPAREAGASDLHLSAGAVPFLRVEGEITRLEETPLSAEDAAALGAEACRLGGADAGLDVDFCFEHDDLGRFRTNHHHHARGVGLSLKCIPREIPELEELGLPDDLFELTY